MKKWILLTSIFALFTANSLFAQKPAANNISAYANMLKGKKVGLTANHTTLVDDKHLLDVLLENNINVVAIYAPEHGFRGTAGAGEIVGDAKDTKTGIVIKSIYGSNKKPSKEQLKGIDYMVFDMQDVGTRFFTYVSTMHYVMEACAELNIPVMVLDRPNPNGGKVDGGVLDPKHTSFVGMHKVPVLHGLTLGELAKMINGEGWLKNGVKCDLVVIPCVNYTKDSKYELPVRPSPNLPNMQSIYLYPSICYFEGTALSLGRGTDFPFQVFGHPDLKGKGNYTFNFTPISSDGKIKPVLERKLCYGLDLRQYDVSKLDGINLEWVIEAYKAYPDKAKFFNNMFTLLSGSTTLRGQIEKGMSAKQIKETWAPDIAKFKVQREKYLIYK